MIMTTRTTAVFGGAPFGSVFAFAAACTTAGLTDVPAPTNNARNCEATPFEFCDAMPPGAGGCMGEPDGSDPVIRGFRTDASFPVGCVANATSPTPDIYGECTLKVSCHCAEAAGSASDAGEADADARPPRHTALELRAVIKPRTAWACQAPSCMG